MMMLDQNKKNILTELYGSVDALAAPVQYVDRLIELGRDKHITADADMNFLGDLYYKFLNDLAAHGQDHATIATAMALQHSRPVENIPYPNIYSEKSVQYITDVASNLFAIRDEGASKSALTLVEKLLAEGRGSDLNDKIDQVITNLLSHEKLHSMYNAEKICDLKLRYSQDSSVTSRKGIRVFDAHIAVAKAAAKDETYPTLQLACRIMDKEFMRYVPGVGPYEGYMDSVNKKKTDDVWSQIARSAAVRGGIDMFYDAQMVRLGMADRLSVDEENILISISDKAGEVIADKNDQFMDRTIDILDRIGTHIHPLSVDKVKRPDTSFKSDKTDDNFRKRKAAFADRMQSVYESVHLNLDRIITGHMQRATPEILDRAHIANVVKNGLLPYVKGDIRWSQPGKKDLYYETWRSAKHSEQTFTTNGTIIKLLLQHNQSPDRLEKAVKIACWMTGPEAIPYRRQLMKMKSGLVDIGVSNGDIASLRQSYKMTTNMQRFAGMGAVYFDRSVMSKSPFPAVEDPKNENYLLNILGNLGKIVHKAVELKTDEGLVLARKAAQLSYRITKPNTLERQESLGLMEKTGLGEKAQELVFDHKFAMFQDGLKQLSGTSGQVSQPVIKPVL